MRIRLSQAGKPVQVFDVPGSEVTLGRTKGVDVFVEHPTVSRRHAKLFHGTVVLDLGSANGTYVQGARIQGAVLVPDGRIALGDPGVVLEIETDEDDATGQRVEDFDATLPAASVAPPVPAMAVAQPSAELDQLRRENEELAGRIRSLKEDAAERSASDGATPEAILATQRLAETQKQYEELKLEFRRVHGELEALRQSASASSGSGESPSALQAEVQRLQHVIASLQEELQRAKNALAEAQSAPQEPELPPSELFAKMHREHAQMRQRIRELEAGTAGEPASASAEADALRQRVLELEQSNEKLRGSAGQSAPVSAPSPGGASGSGDAALTAANAELERKVAALTKQLEEEKRSRTRSSAGSVPASQVAPMPSRGVGKLLQSLVDDDVEGLPPLWTAPPDEFIVQEQFRFLRHVERCVTRMAGEFIQIFEARTIVPGMEGNYLSYASDVLLAPQDRPPRDEVVRYLEELCKWLVASLGAYRQGAKRFADKLRADLSESGLTSAEPIPAFKKVAGQTDAELWKRANAYLKELTPEVVEERIDALARDSAQIIIKSPNPEL